MNETSRIFDRVLILLAVIAVFVTGIAVIVVVRNPASAAGGGEATEPTVAHVELSEFAITGDLAVPEGAVTLEVENVGTVAHNLSIHDGPTTPDIQPGETVSLDLGEMTAGEHHIFCAIAGHESAGMAATLTVGEATGDGSHQGHSEQDYQAMDAAMTSSILAFPAATEGSGNQPLEPVSLDDGTKQFEITASVVPWEVEPGKIVDAWAYNGQVPGPAIHVEDGDRIRVIVHNELPMGTDVHFHGIVLENPMDGVAPLTQPVIEPGDDFTYEFVAEGPAVAMYHAHHHGQLQVPNGLFGTLLIGEVPLPTGQVVGGVEIPADLDVAQELPMVLNDAGVIGFSLNGKSFPATQPLALTTGDWFVTHYYNEGLQIHPMHLHGFPQLVYAKDGFPLEQPYWVDTLDVAPGERYSVLVHAERAGAWVWHCHILNHVEREEGMFGMVTAVVVED